MKISREKKKTEAILRMKMLGIHPAIIWQFDKNDLVSVSYPPLGGLFWVDNETLQHISEFEEKYNALVYLVVRSNTCGYKMDNFLFVSDYEEEWLMDWTAIGKNQTFAYSYNCDEPVFSEFGTIGIERTPAASIVRTW